MDSEIECVSSTIRKGNLENSSDSMINLERGRLNWDDFSVTEIEGVKTLFLLSSVEDSMVNSSTFANSTATHFFSVQKQS